MEGELKFPVVAHHRLVVRSDEKDTEGIARLFAAFELVEPVAKARVSSNGRYVSYGVSVRLRDRAEADRLDERLKLVPGLKMVL